MSQGFSLDKTILIVLSIFAGALIFGIGHVGLFDPWETHYGEVTREMVVRGDYLYPFWKNAYFFSKPILLFWLELPGGFCIESNPAGVPISGWCTALFRLPSIIVGIVSLAVIYGALTRIYSVSRTRWTLLILCTTPYWFFLSKQAITDILFVGPTSAAFVLLMVALYAPRDQQPLSRGTAAFMTFCIFAQLMLIAFQGEFLNDVTILGTELNARVISASVVGVLLTPILFRWFLRTSNPDLHWAAFWFAFATLGKGPHGVVFACLTVVLIGLFQSRFAFLRQKSVWSAALLYVGLIAPWFITMLFFDGHNHDYKTWFQRYILHDLLGRVGGVHGDRGGFEYYLRSLGFGCFPWLPILFWGVFKTPLPRLEHPSKDASQKPPSAQADAFVWFWFMILLFFFSYTTTKFHHYIAPLTVPAAILASKLLDDLVRKRVQVTLVGLLLIGLTYGLILRELAFAPWEWMDLFTYHYKGYEPKYYFPEPAPYRIIIGVIGVLSLGIGVTLLLSVNRPDWIHGGHFMKRRIEKYIPDYHTGHALSIAFAVAAGLFTVYGTTHYYIQAGRHWTQAELIGQVLELRRSPRDRLIAYQMDWKGEVFYSRNTDIQVRKKRSKLLDAIRQSDRAFILIQSDRYEKLENILKSTYRDKYKTLPIKNAKWIVVQVDVEERSESSPDA